MPSMDRWRRRVAGALWAATLTAGAACYRAVPVADVAPDDVGRRVVVSLTGRGSDDLATALGPGVVRAEGLVTAARDDTLELALLRTEQGSGASYRWQRQRVRLPRALIATVGERRLDRHRSWTLVGAVLGLVALGVGFGAGGGGAGGGREGTGVEPAH